MEPFFPYEVRNYLNYWWGNSSLHGPPVYAYPNKAISDKLALQIVTGLLHQSISGFEIHDSVLTRGGAAILIHRILNKKNDFTEK